MESSYLFVAISGILSGFIVFGSQVFANLGLSLYQFSVFSAIFIIPVLPFVILKEKYRIKKSMIKLLAVFGFLSALTNFTEFGPVFLGVPVAVVVLLLYTQPLWTSILSRVVLKERITRYKILAIIIVLVGVVLLLSPSEAITASMLPGITLALIGGVLLSVWVIFGRVAGIRNYNPVATKFGYTLFMVLFLLAFYSVLSMFISSPTIMSISLDLAPVTWLYLLIFSVFAIFVTHILYFQGMKNVTASSAGIILLLEPIVAAALASVFLHQPITLNVLAGGALILAANYFVIRKE